MLLPSHVSYVAHQGHSKSFIHFLFFPSFIYDCGMLLESESISKFQMIMERKFQPVIVFSFSRRECEQHAMSMSKLDFNTQEEKDTVEQVFQNAVDCLNEEDRNLPAIELMLPLLKRGIAVHHSGLLPVIKELVELLFQEGLVKALFATETVRFSLCIVFLYFVLNLSPTFWVCGVVHFFSLYTNVEELLHFILFVIVCHGFKHACQDRCVHSC